MRDKPFFVLLLTNIVLVLVIIISMIFLKPNEVRAINPEEGIDINSDVTIFVGLPDAKNDKGEVLLDFIRYNERQLLVTRLDDGLYVTALFSDYDKTKFLLASLEYEYKNNKIEAMA